MTNRRHIRLNKYLKLNLGKRGMSITVDSGKGLKGTVHTSGNLTATAGIPGTGVYKSKRFNVKEIKKKIDAAKPLPNTSETAPLSPEPEKQVESRLVFSGLKLENLRVIKGYELIK